MMLIHISTTNNDAGQPFITGGPLEALQILTTLQIHLVVTKYSTSTIHVLIRWPCWIHEEPWISLCTVIVMVQCIYLGQVLTAKQFSKTQRTEYIKNSILRIFFSLNLYPVVGICTCEKAEKRTL